MQYCSTALLALVTPLVIVAQSSGCQLEIASVKELKGTWQDTKYVHILVPNQTICDDSHLVRVRDEKATVDDFLVLKTRKGQDLPPYQCKRLLGCEAPLDLGDIAREASRQLKGASLLGSFLDWPSASALISTLSRDLLLEKGSNVLESAVVAAGAPVLAGVVFRPTAAAGKYFLELCDLTSADYCGNPRHQRREITLSVGDKALLPFPALSPGLHVISRLDQQNQFSHTGDVAYLLSIAPPERAGQPDLLGEAQDKFSIALRATEASEDPETSQMLLVQYIKSLAADVGSAIDKK